MSIAGVYARKGYEFQDAVAAFFAVRILEVKELVSMAVEVPELRHPSNVSVDDIVLCHASGKRTFIQVKSTSPDGKGWSISSLQRHKELEKIIARLQASDTDSVELICPDGFGDLALLKKDLSPFTDLSAFKARAAKMSLRRLADFCEKAALVEAQAFVYVKDRIALGLKYRLEGWREEIRRRVSSDQASQALQRFIVEHSTRRGGLPDVLTREMIRKALAAPSHFQACIAPVDETTGDTPDIRAHGVIS
jgi:hypothetical protein